MIYYFTPLIVKGNSPFTCGESELLNVIPCGDRGVWKCNICGELFEYNIAMNHSAIVAVQDEHMNSKHNKSQELDYQI